MVPNTVGYRHGPWTEAAYGTRCSSALPVQTQHLCRRTSAGRGVRDQLQTSQQWFSWNDEAGRPSSPGDRLGGVAPVLQGVNYDVAVVARDPWGQEWGRGRVGSS